MWRVVETEIFTGEEYVRSFGIGGQTVEINDISVVREEIEEFVELLNRLDASEIHAHDLVEDFLGDDRRFLTAQNKK